ncbi:MAG: monofunctional biosynthetic peptidoglycan transglycosylase [Leadbetterella sp.]|nr:monofunctional biosynthetic peptidoglycan transglycosylase [Leadbetterella sp.]
MAKAKTSFLVLLRQLLLKGAFYFFALSVGGVILFKFLPIPFTMTMIDRKVKSIMRGEDSEIHYSWRSYNRVSREMHLAAVAAEDQNFPNHWGFDFKALGKAYTNNQKGKKVRGASTISQQVAKNVFLWQGRSYLRKALEFYFTGLIELIWGKQRILEVYVNVAEMGKNTFGAEAAARRIFKKPAQNLTRAEAARLAAVLPSPNKWSAAKPGPYVTRRTAVIQKYMRALGGVKYIADLRRF